MHSIYTPRVVVTSVVMAENVVELIRGDDSVEVIVTQVTPRAVSSLFSVG